MTTTLFRRRDFSMGLASFLSVVGRSIRSPFDGTFGRTCLDPFSFLIVSVSGWLNRRQQQVIEYLVEENRVLRAQIGRHRLRFTDGAACHAPNRGSVGQKTRIKFLDTTPFRKLKCLAMPTQKKNLRLGWAVRLCS